MKHLWSILLVAAVAGTAPLYAQDTSQDTPQGGADAEIRLPDLPEALIDPPQTPAQAPSAPAPSDGPLPQIGGWSRSGAGTTVQERTWDLGLRVLDTSVPQGRIMMGASFPEPGILRLTGEDASVALALSLPADETPPVSFDLVLRSSVSNLPDHSWVTVSVNGQEAGQWPLSNVEGFGTITVPGTALKAGINTVDLSLHQHHRIFCGPEASFDVWTEINLPDSGVTVPAGAVKLTAGSFRAGVTNIVQRGEKIDVRMPEGVSTDTLAAVMGAIGANVSDSAAILVRSPYEPVDRAGRRVGVALRQGTGGAADISFLRSPQGALVMQVTEGTGLADLLARTFPAQDAERDPQALTPGRETTFKELGAPLIVRNTHYAQAEVPFSLPKDWMNLSSQRAMLTLDYGYGKDLTDGSILLVKANGETIILLPLDVDGGKVQPSLRVRFPINLLHGGHNTISFEMIVPGDPATFECPERDSDMLVVLNSSTLNVPPTPPMAFGPQDDELQSIGGEDVMAPAAEPDFVHTFIGQLSLQKSTQGTARLQLAQLPQDFNTLDTRLPLDREEIAHIFQTRGTSAPQGADRPQFFRLNEAEDDAPAQDPQRADGLAASLKDWLGELVAPEGPTLSQWIVNRSAVAVLMAPTESDMPWTLVADTTLAPEVLAASFTQFRASDRAQGTRVALRTQDGTWQTWPPTPRPHVVGPIAFNQIFQVVGNFASWAPGFYALILLALSVLSTIPALIYVILTRKDRNQ